MDLFLRKLVCNVAPTNKGGRHVYIYVCIYIYIHTHITFIHYIYVYLLLRTLVCNLAPTNKGDKHVYTYVYTSVYIHALCVCITSICTYSCASLSAIQHPPILNVQPIADGVALHLDIIFKTISTNLNSAHGIYD